MWVKICANTNLEDAKLAAQLGADAVGFVFAPSKRQVTAEQVAAIVSELPVPLEKIGVFATHDAEEIAGIVRATGLTGAQLHGGFDAELARRLRVLLGDDLTIIQTLHWVVKQTRAIALRKSPRSLARSLENQRLTGCWWTRRLEMRAAGAAFPSTGMRRGRRWRVLPGGKVDRRWGIAARECGRGRLRA